MKMTPMMEQYMEIKEKYQDCILFFRLGDFYEMFFDDAIKASKELEITLTSKNFSKEDKIPMCGVPFHSAEGYIVKLIDKGYKVAICEQVEDPKETKGIVKREVIQVITPGTVLNNTMLNEKNNNFIISVFATEKGIGLAYCDISTGELLSTEIKGSNLYENLLNELVKIQGKEILINANFEEKFSIEDLELVTNAYVSKIESFYNDYNNVEEILFRHFKIKSISAIGLMEGSSVAYALGGLLNYIIETGKNRVSHIIELKNYELGEFMSLDKSTLRNLEITETLYEKNTKGSLLGILDKTETAMGSRKLKQWLKEPLNKIEPIRKRLNAVEFLIDNYLLQNNLRELLKAVYDLERLSGRIASKNANGKDLIALKKSINILPELKSDLKSSDDELLNKLGNEIDDELFEIYDLIDRAIVEDPPFTVKEGHLIKENFSDELDELRLSIKDGQVWLANLEEQERERTGIKSLKVRYNKVFGYYIEVTKTNLDMVPEDYVRKQTLVNSERYITPKLKEMESIVLNAEGKINQLEYNLFCDIRDELEKYIRKLQLASTSIAITDVLTSFAKVSEENNYVKPVVNEDDNILIIKGRHPVVEKNMNSSVFVSNDLYMDRENDSTLLITGPNMAGKSTYMRQNALIVLMAQSGCFVPCDEAKIGIVDRIYTRIGASDNLSRGQSTFFVEMSELAYILNTATEKSLIILDEIGRGTSTYDGLSIAEATVHFVCNENNKIRTLFATHYHELASLENIVQGVKNLNVDVAENKGEIVFLHKIVEGFASDSYGIHVAKLAGVPNVILENAKIILEGLESKNNKEELSFNNYTIQEKLHSENDIANQIKESQMSFLPDKSLEIIEKLKSLDLKETTLSDVLKIVEELQNV